MRKYILMLFFLLSAISTSMGQWTSLNNSFGVDIRCMIKAGSALVVGTNGNGIYYSPNSDQNWIQKNSGLSNLKVYSLAGNGTLIGAGTYGGGVFLSNNNGDSWTSTGSGITVPFIYALAFLGNNIISGTGGGGIFKSVNNGSSWSSTGGTTHIVNSIYVAQNYSFLGQGPYAYKSTDNGDTWSTLIGQSNTTIKGFAETPKAGGGTNIFVATLDGVYVSVDDGKSWKKTNSGLLYTNINSLVAAGENLFAATEGGGVFRSSNNGASWNEINSGLPANTNARTLVLNNGILYLGTEAGVVWKLSLSDLGITSVKQVSDEIPAEFELSQNYPNPFNPETTISYKVSVVSNVSLKVYDLLGKEIATLVNEVQQPGSYNVKFSINPTLSAGIYFYKLQADNFAQTKKMMLIK